MFLKAIVVVLVVNSIVADDLPTVTNKMRKTIEWLKEHSKLDKNSTIILAVASGSMMKQIKGGLETQEQAAYLDQIIKESKEKLLGTDPEAKYFSSEKFKFVGEFDPQKTVTNKPVGATPTIYDIYYDSQSTKLYKMCLDKFYENNPEPLADSGRCAISPRCMNAMLDPSKGIGSDLRNRFIMMSEKIHKCNNFSPNYDAVIADHMQELNDQINSFFKYINEHDGKLDPRLRYTFLRKIILMATSGYNVITPEVETYVNSLYNAEGYCGVAGDVDMDKVMLSAQCYAIWTFKRQVLLDA